MALYDISVALAEDLPSFPGDPPIRIRPRRTEGGTFRLTALSFGSHAGTHIDAPAHLHEQGARVADIPLSLLVGPCLVVDLARRAGPIDASDLRGINLQGCPRILLRTRNSRLWQRPGFDPDYDALTPEGADYLLDKGVRLAGIDYLSIDPFDSSGEAHRRLLAAGVVILEGLDLSEVSRGSYELICLPLKTLADDGAPCRAILRAPDPPAGYPEHQTGWPP